MSVFRNIKVNAADAVQSHRVAGDFHHHMVIPGVGHFAEIPLQFPAFGGGVDRGIDLGAVIYSV